MSLFLVFTRPRPDQGILGTRPWRDVQLLWSWVPSSFPEVGVDTVLEEDRDPGVRPPTPRPLYARLFNRHSFTLQFEGRVDGTGEEGPRGSWVAKRVVVLPCDSVGVGVGDYDDESRRTLSHLGSIEPDSVRSTEDRIVVRVKS